jgi:SepF-like predicted cell division protein (DUF552 family)
MKLPYQNKRVLQLESDLENKKNELEIATKILVQYITDKASLKDMETQITKRNLLFIDISNIESQILNLVRGKNQYGVEFQERNVSKWIGNEY